MDGEMQLDGSRILQLLAVLSSVLTSQLMTPMVAMYKTLGSLTGRVQNLAASQWGP